MMKIIKLLTLTAFFITLKLNFTMAQTNIAGVYKRSTGNPEGGNTFFIFDDHKFVVAFFGGVIVGTWSMENNKIHFKPNVKEHSFYIYGRHNKDLKNSSKIYFQGFSEGPTFIGLGKKQAEKPLLTSVFNENPNCVPYPSVAKFEEIPAQILFTDLPYGDDAPKRAMYTFDNSEKYNDFIAYYDKDDLEKRPFDAELKGDKIYFGYDEKGSTKYPLPTKGEDFEFVKQLLAAPQSTDKVFYNPFYNESGEDVNDKLNWKFNESKNAFINFQNYVEGEENRPDEQDAYNKMNIVYQFNLLKLAQKEPKAFAKEAKPLFVATCEERD